MLLLRIRSTLRHLSKTCCLATAMAVSSVSWEAGQHEYWPVKQHTQVPRPSYEKTEAEQCRTVLSFIAASGSAQPFLASWLFGAALRGAALASHQAGSRSSARAAAMFGGWCGNSKSLQGRTRCIGRGVMGKVAQG